MLFRSAYAIGEDPRLAKAAALYHDIGKIENPEFFTENQTDGYNPHDELIPEVSVKMITRHTEAGAKILTAKGFPKEIISAALEHHGYLMSAAADATADFLYACNTFNVQEISGPFNTVYKVGSNTLGLPVPSGERGTYTRLDEGDICRFGIGNFTTAISTNGYGTLGTSTNAGKIVPAASAPTATGTWYFIIEGSGKFTQGAYAGFDYVDAKVHRVHTVPAG